MIPGFTINWNKILSAVAALGATLVTYFVQEEALRAALILFITTSMGAMSVKAQTMDPQGKQLEEKVKKGDTVYESAKTPVDSGGKAH